MQGDWQNMRKVTGALESRDKHDKDITKKKKKHMYNLSVVNTVTKLQNEHVFIIHIKIWNTLAIKQMKKQLLNYINKSDIQHFT